MTRILKKIISGIVSASMMLMMCPTTALASEATLPAAATAVDVTIRTQMDNAYLIGFADTVNVSSDLAEYYGFADAVTGVSALDALVAEHELVFGEDFTVETAPTYLSVDENGYVSTLFGAETKANGFLVNGGYPNDGTEAEWGGGYNGTTVSTTEIFDEDVIDFFTYGDTSSWSDYYSFIDAAVDSESGKINATVIGNMVMAGYSYIDAASFKAAAAPIEDVCFGWVDPATGVLTPIVGAVADEDGKVAIDIPSEAGKYYLTALTNYEEEVYILCNPTMIEVGNVVEPSTVTVTVNAQNNGEFLLPINTSLTVASDLAEEYGFTDDITEGVSVLDALVAAHEYAFENFSVDTLNDYLVCSEAGYVSKMFGVNGGDNSFMVNGCFPNDGVLMDWGYNGTFVNTTKISDNDNLDFMFCIDKDLFSDVMSYIELGSTSCANVAVSASEVAMMAGFSCKDGAALREIAKPATNPSFAWFNQQGNRLASANIAKELNGEFYVERPVDENGEEYDEAYLTVITDSNTFVVMNPIKVTFSRHTPAEQTVKLNEQPATYKQNASYDEITVCETCEKELSKNHVELEGSKLVAKTQRITAKSSKFSFTYNPASALSKAVYIFGAQGKVTYTSSNKNIKVSNGKVVVAKGTPVGKYTIKVKAAATDSGEYKASNELTLTVNVDKADNPMKVTPLRKTLRASALKTKPIIFNLTVTKAQGKVTYTSSSRKVKVSKTGKVTVTKGTKKGVYTIKVKAAGNSNYFADTVKVKITVK